MNAVPWHREFQERPIASAGVVGGPRSRGYYARAFGQFLLICLMAPLTGVGALAISITPASRSITASHSTTYTANANGGTPPYTYQWQITLDGFNWVPIDNFIWSAGTADTNILSLPNVSLALNPSQIRCRVSDSIGSFALSGNGPSTPSTLAVNAWGSPNLYIIRNPGGRMNFGYFSCVAPPFHMSALSGGTPAQISFTLVYDGGSGLGASVVWQVSTDNGVTWTNISSGSQYNVSVGGKTLYLPSPQTTDNGHLFQAVVTDVGTPTITVTTNPARLDVGDPIVANANSSGDGTNNGSLTAHYGTPSTATFRVYAWGTTALTYQWMISTDFGNSYANASGASTSATYSVPVNSVSQNQNMYECVVTDSNGSTTSNPMLLTAIP